jgi:hypothetical protein
MKSIKSILFASLIGLMLVMQLLNPIGVSADGEGTPPPANTAEVTSTPPATEPVVETAMPSSTPEITLTPEETTSPTDVPAVTPTSQPNEPTVEPIAMTSIATEFATSGPGEPTAEPIATTPAPTIVPTEKEDETKVAPTDTSTPTAEPVVSEEENTVEEPSLGEVLSEIPAETEVIVLDESGQPEPLATVEAAEAISSGDPIWCPTGATPGDPSCSASYANLSALVAGFVPTGNGTIWISAGNDSSTSAIVIDGFGNWAAASSYSLTIQGGWSGVNGDTTVGSNSVFTVPITIESWWGDLNVSNLTISGTDETGLSVYTITGDVNVANIISSNNQGHGAYFRGRNVILTGTNVFNDNSGTGIYVDPWSGAIALNNVTANNNGGNGIYAVASSGITMNNITASNNGVDGILATSLFETGITMNNITANNNAGSGILAALNGSGDITLNNIIANYNQWGVLSASANGSGTITIQNTNVAGNCIGISVYDTDVIMSNVSISNNEVGLQTDGIKSITFTNTNFVNNGVDRIDFNYNCDAPAPIPTPIFVRSEGKFALDCSKQAAYPVQLPNGDFVNIICPVSGSESIHQLTNTGLPANLPEGYTYASAFKLDILQQGVSIPVITEGGYVKSSFVAQPLQPGDTYTVLYWDPWIYENGKLVDNPSGGSWVPLKDFLLDGNGNVESFNLFPGTDDPRMVISGVNLVSESNVDRVEVSTNFPGIFVLAQH